jgi:hypothetical protein
MSDRAPVRYVQPVAQPWLPGTWLLDSSLNIGLISMLLWLTVLVRLHSPTAWMQTTGATLLAVKRYSLARVSLAAQDSHSVRGLLYPTAVRDD